MVSDARVGFRKPAAILLLAPTAALYRGPLLGVGMHRGAVHCIAEAATDALVASSVDGASTGLARAVFVRAGTEHRLDGTCDDARILYLSAADAIARSAHASFDPIASNAALGRASHPVMASLAALSATERSRAPLDPRVRAAVVALDAGEDLACSAEEQARRGRLSESRFLHVFQRSMGVAFRRYRLWARMRSAALAIGAGASITDAALQARFASPAHFSAAFRAMFGATPSALGGLSLRACASTADAIAGALDDG